MIKKDFVVIVILLALAACTQRTYVPRAPAMPNSSYNYNNAYAPRSYQPHYQPNSGAYSNPYSQPPRNYYPYYDFDQYYSPPTQYRSYEGYDSNTESSSKF